MALEIGTQLPALILRWAADSEQVFSLQFKDGDNVALTWDTGDVMRLKFGNGDTYNATLTLGGYATWIFDDAPGPTYSDPIYLGQTVRLEYLIGGTDVVLFGQGKVKPA